MKQINYAEGGYVTKEFVEKYSDKKHEDFFIIPPNIRQAQSIVGTSKGRPENDFYPTPPEATEGLLNNYKFKKNIIWECACGDGAISKVLKRYGFDVISSDKYDYGYGAYGYDFLEFESRFSDTIITNPPFKLAEEFIRHAFNIKVTNLALLLKLSFLEGQKRKQLFSELPPKEILVFSKRLTMTRNGEPLRNGGMIAFAWFIWEFENKTYPIVRWI